MVRSLCLSLALLAIPSLGLAQKTKTPPTPTPEDLLQKAAEKEAAGDLDGAIDILRKSPDGKLTLQMGRLLERKHDLDTAVEAYQKAAGSLSGAEKGEALGRLALVQELRGLPGAKESASGAHGADADGPWPRVAWARALAGDGKGDEALALANQATAAGASAKAAVAFAQEARGDLAAAEAAAKEAVAAEADNLLANVELARILRLAHRPAEALPILQKVIEKAPGAVLAYIESARSKMSLGRAAEAEGDAQTAAAVGEGDTEAQALLKEVGVASALDHLKANQSQVAIQDLSMIVAKDPNYAPAHVGLARAYMAMKQPDKAAAELEAALKADPNLAEAHYQKGYLLQVYNKDPQGAIPSYERAVALKPNDVAYRTQFGSALFEAKAYDRAIEELTRLTAMPGYNSPEGFVSLGAAQVTAKHYKEAIPPLEKAIALAPTNAQAEAYLAWSYFGLKDATNFKLHGAKARTLGYNEPTLLAYLGRIEKGEAIK
jgi:tetratricopeptide (TPR) repeat protein